MGLVCHDDCVPLTWEFLDFPIYIGKGLSFMLFWATIAASFYQQMYLVDQEKWTLRRHQLRSSRVFVFLYLGLAVGQTCIFCYRTVEKSVGFASLLWELVATGFYFVDFVVSFMEANTGTLQGGLKFWCTWGIADSFLLPAVLCLMRAVDGKKTWGSLSLLSSLHILQAWQWLFVAFKKNLQILKWRVLNLAGVAAMLVLFAALLMLLLEMVGDPSSLKPLASESSIVRAVFLVVSSFLTVGLGGVAPTSSLGRIAIVGAVFGGICVLGSTVQKVLQTAQNYRAGGGAYSPNVRTRPVFVSGNPLASMCKDLIAEIFHPDHADDAEDLHLIFCFPGGGPEMDELIRWSRLKQNIKMSARMAIFRGSVLDSEHLRRVSATKAEAFLILPNSNCDKPLQEDAENIIRMMSVRRFMPWARVILLLLKAESRGLLKDAGLSASAGDSNLTIVAADQFKLELVGKSIDVLGFAPLICNLCSSIGELPEEENGTSKPVWRKEYERGVGNELYEIELSPLYGDKRQATFSEVVLDVLEQNGGTVYLIGLVEQRVKTMTKSIIVNPGPQYPIKATSSGIKTYGIFIAADRDSVQQCEVNMVFLGRRERHGHTSQNSRLRRAAVEAAKRPAPRTRTPAEQALAAVAGPQLRARALELVALSRTHSHGAEPRRPPLQTLAAGGHVLFLCIGAQDERDFRLGIEHFVRPLRQEKEFKDMLPIVVMAPVLPMDWETVCDQHAVYFFKGSPLYQMDLERANFRAASSIFICNVASGTGDIRTEGWVVDSGAICCSRLVEAQLTTGSHTLAVVDLKCNTNHSFLPVPTTSNTGSGLDEPLDDWRPDSVYLETSEDEKRIFVRQSFAGNADVRKPRKSVLQNLKRKSRTSWSSAVTVAALRVKGQIERAEKMEDAKQAPEPFYLQPRFASGQMFCNSVVTCLVANTFYNPSLSELVSSMIASVVHIQQVPKHWVGKSYFEFFDHLLVEEGRLCVGILRRADPSELGESDALMESEGTTGEAADTSNENPAQKRRFAFVYTAPPAKETTMAESDRVLCFGVSPQVAGRAAK